MATLADCIARYEIAHYEADLRAQMGPHTTLTPPGDATVTLYRLKRQLAALDPEQRAEIAGLAVVELGLLPGPLPGPEEKDARYCFFCCAEYPAGMWDCPNHSPLA